MRCPCERMYGQSPAQCQVGERSRMVLVWGRAAGPVGGAGWLGYVSAAVSAMVATRGGDTCGSMVTGLSGKGTGVAEVELTSEASCWLFPCPGLPHHRCLPDPTESQGTPRLQVAWPQRPRERSHHRSLRPGFWNTEACGITALGEAPSPEATPTGGTLCHAPS